MRGELVISRGKSRGRRFVIAAGQRLTFGRSERARIQMFDEGLSRLHCCVENRGDSVVITDLDSRNGTFVNGERVKSAFLRPGDTVTLGLATIEFRTIGEREKRSTTSLKIDEAGGEGALKKRFDPTQTQLFAATTEEALRRAHRNLATIYEVGNAINSETDPSKLFSTVAESVLKVTGGDRAAVLTISVEKGGLEMAVALDRASKRPPEEVRVPRTIVNDVTETGASTLSQDAMGDARYLNGDSVVAQKVRSMMCAPLVSGEEVLGALYVDSSRIAGAFGEEDLDLLSAIGIQAGIALKRMRLMKEMEELFFGTVKTLAAAIDAKDAYTRGHSERVTNYALALAREVANDEHTLRIIRLAGLLHDVGKIGVPESVLNKPGSLDEEEWKHVRAHPVRGAEIIAYIKNPDVPTIVAAVRHHHERWDGSGYPDGLQGEACPVEARILAVADAFDAMTSNRPYRRSRSAEDALEEIGSKAGSQFDPELAGAFVLAEVRPGGRGAAGEG